MKGLKAAIASVVVAAPCLAQPRVEVLTPPTDSHTRIVEVATSRDGATVFKATVFSVGQLFSSTMSVRRAGESTWTGLDSGPVWISVLAVSADGRAMALVRGTWALWRDGHALEEHSAPYMTCINADGSCYGIGSSGTGWIQGDANTPARAVRHGVTSTFPDAGAVVLYDITPDGSRFGGLFNNQPMLWTPGSAPEYLASPAGEAHCAVLRLTPDPDQVLLQAEDRDARRETVYRWTRAGGAELLASRIMSSADAWVEADDWGRLLYFREPFGRTSARIWTPRSGFITTDQYLRMNGVDLSLLGLSNPLLSRFSGDGRVLCGSATSATRTEYWVVTGLPGTCPQDFNNDGFLDFFDYADYVDCFESGSCPQGRTADFNGDGFADFFDYGAFVDAFEAGC